MHIRLDTFPTFPPRRFASLDKVSPRLHRDLGITSLDATISARSLHLRETLLRHFHRGR